MIKVRLGFGKRCRFGRTGEQALKARRASSIQSIGIGVCILLITALHLTTPLDQIVFHQTYQRLYYIPIIIGALLFGLRGELAAALFASVAYTPHILLHWQHADYDYALNQYAEIILFNVVGCVTGVLGDMTRRARRRAEQSASELQKAYAELRQTFEQLLRADRIASVGELSAAVVHEVRNPLASIKGAIEIVEDELAPDSPRREFSNIIKQEVDRLDSLVGEFLRFARTPKPSVAPASLNEIARSVSTLIAQRAATQHVAIALALAEDLPSVTADSEQIKQVLLNFAINSLQAMPDGGRLTLRTSRDEDEVSVEVEDTGGGIDAALQARIFDPFFTTRDKGVGLGLSIAYKIAAQHGGSLMMTNGTHGAIFRLTLPPR
ncbi:MAG: ATP-binding protein [Pyrinomonadaceae bacterium MAG19_C2-C3]|nr:ATP-binding protein [Pyrinomonadaceae bacterium MAG19_C2-C3]